MWRPMVGLEEQTRAEKRSAASAINLFFGALIGANLGALERLALRDYVLLICIIALIVMYIQMAPVARKRGSLILHLTIMVGALYVLLMTPYGEIVFADRPRPPPHLFVTIALWLASVAAVELKPVSKPKS